MNLTEHRRDIMERIGTDIGPFSDFIWDISSKKRHLDCLYILAHRGLYVPYPLRRTPGEAWRFLFSTTAVQYYTK